MSRRKVCPKIIDDVRKNYGFWNTGKNMKYFSDKYKISLSTVHSIIMRLSPQAASSQDYVCECGRKATKKNGKKNGCDRCIQLTSETHYSRSDEKILEERERMAFKYS